MTSVFNIQKVKVTDTATFLTPGSDVQECQRRILELNIEKQRKLNELEELRETKKPAKEPQCNSLAYLDKRFEELFAKTDTTIELFSNKKENLLFPTNIAALQESIKSQLERKISRTTAESFRNCITDTSFVCESTTKQMDSFKVEINRIEKELNSKNYTPAISAQEATENRMKNLDAKQTQISSLTTVLSVLNNNLNDILATPSHASTNEDISQQTLNLLKENAITNAFNAFNLERKIIEIKKSNSINPVSQVIFEKLEKKLIEAKNISAKDNLNKVDSEIKLQQQSSLSQRRAPLLLQSDSQASTTTKGVCFDLDCSDDDDTQIQQEFTDTQQSQIVPEGEKALTQNYLLSYLKMYNGQDNTGSNLSFKKPQQGISLDLDSSGFQDDDNINGEQSMVEKNIHSSSDQQLSPKSEIIRLASSSIASTTPKATTSIAEKKDANNILTRQVNDLLLWKISNSIDSQPAGSRYFSVAPNMRQRESQHEILKQTFYNRAEKNLIKNCTSTPLSLELFAKDAPTKERVIYSISEQQQQPQPTSTGLTKPAPAINTKTAVTNVQQIPTSQQQPLKQQLPPKQEKPLNANPVLQSHTVGNPLSSDEENESSEREFSDDESFESQEAQQFTQAPKKQQQQPKQGGFAQDAPSMFKQTQATKQNAQFQPPQQNTTGKQNITPSTSTAATTSLNNTNIQPSQPPPFNTLQAGNLTGIQQKVPLAATLLTEQKGGLFGEQPKPKPLGSTSTQPTTNSLFGTPKTANIQTAQVANLPPAEPKQEKISAVQVASLPPTEPKATAAQLASISLTEQLSNNNLPQQLTQASAVLQQQPTKPSVIFATATPTSNPPVQQGAFPPQQAQQRPQPLFNPAKPQPVATTGLFNLQSTNNKPDQGKQEDTSNQQMNNKQSIDTSLQSTLPNSLFPPSTSQQLISNNGNAGQQPAPITAFGNLGQKNFLGQNSGNQQQQTQVQAAFSMQPNSLSQGGLFGQQQHQNTPAGGLFNGQNTTLTAPNNGGNFAAFQPTKQSPVQNLQQMSFNNSQPGLGQGGLFQSSQPSQGGTAGLFAQTSVNNGNMFGFSQPAANPLGASSFGSTSAFGQMGQAQVTQPFKMNVSALSFGSSISQPQTTANGGGGGMFNSFVQNSDQSFFQNQKQQNKAPEIDPSLENAAFMKRRK